MSTASIVYAGNLRTTSTHTRSGAIISTDAPPDNHGLGEAFSPTDLVSSALVSCMMTIMGIAARTHQIDLTGLAGRVEKLMASDPRRINKLVVHLYLPGNFDQKQKRILEEGARNCPVAKSLHPDLVQEIHFHYGTSLPA